jgi:hypothetical protein
LTELLEGEDVSSFIEKEGGTSVYSVWIFGLECVTDLLKLMSTDRQSGKSILVEYTTPAISAKLMEPLGSSVLPTKLLLD